MEDVSCEQANEAEDGTELGAMRVDNQHAQRISVDGPMVEDSPMNNPLSERLNRDRKSVV